MTRLFGHGRASVPARTRRYRPGVESVEARQLLTTFLVTTAADTGFGSLRQAILAANTSTTPSVIDFQIGSGPQTIIPSTPLPVITNPVTIDATTQPGFAGTPLIQINGSQIFAPNTTPPNTFPLGNVAGLVVSAGNSTIRGLDINRFTGPGIFLTGGGHNLIAGNYIGTDLYGHHRLRKRRRRHLRRHLAVQRHRRDGRRRSQPRLRQLRQRHRHQLGRVHHARSTPATWSKAM